jgi:RimJ/RimL family protein N-acetyltransferase
MAFLSNHILSPRLCITNFDESDIDNHYLSWLNDPKVTEFSNQRFSSHNFKTSLIYLKSFENTNNYFLKITLQDKKIKIGTLTIYYEKNHEVADIGIMIGNKDYWNNGYGKEAFKTTIVWLLNNTNVRKITCGTIDSNHSMKKTALSCGMEIDCIKKKQEILNGIPCDIVFFYLLRP